MPYLNANIPPIECYVRGNYLRNQQDSHDKFFECVIFGISSIPSKAVLFNILMDDGGIFWHLPISAFCWKKTKELSLDDLELWDSFSYNVSVTTFYVLENKKIQYFDRHGVFRNGTYLFTLDWSDGDYNELKFGFAEAPDQHKAGHVIALDDGNYAIQPNNRIKVFDPSFCTKKEWVIERLLNEQNYSVERSPKVITEDSNNYNYKLVPSEIEDGT